MLALQRLVGNRGVTALLARSPSVQRFGDDGKEDLEDTLRQAMKRRREMLTAGEDKEPQLPQREQLRQATERRDLSETLRSGLQKRRAMLTGEPVPEVEEQTPTSFPVSEFTQHRKLEGTQRLKKRLGPMAPVEPSSEPDRPEDFGELPMRGPSQTKGPVQQQYEQSRSEHRQHVTSALAVTGEENRKKQARESAENTPAFKTAKKYAGTDLEPPEYGDVVKAIDSPLLNFSAALDALKEAARGALERATKDRKLIPLEQATTHPVYKAPYLTQAAEEADKHLSEKDWIQAPASVTSLRKSVSLVTSAITRYGVVTGDIEGLINELETYPGRVEAGKKNRPKKQWVIPEAPVLDKQKQTNLEGWLREHRVAAQSVTTDEQFATLLPNSKPGLGFIEEKVRYYRESKAQGEAANAAARQREEEQKRLKDAGLIGGTGAIIEEKAPSDFPNEEKTAIETSINNFNNNSGIPALTHPNGAKWGATFGNRDRDLPTGRTYREYYVQKAPGSNTYHGNRRLVISGDRIYYTNTHYGENGDPPFYKMK